MHPNTGQAWGARRSPHCNAPKLESPALPVFPPPPLRFPSGPPSRPHPSRLWYESRLLLTASIGSLAFHTQACSDRANINTQKQSSAPSRSLNCVVPSTVSPKVSAKDTFQPLAHPTSASFLTDAAVCSEQLWACASAKKSEKPPITDGVTELGGEKRRKKREAQVPYPTSSRA